MAGKFTNLRYDQDAYNDQINTSTYPLLYKLDANRVVNCNPCFSAYGPRGGNQNAVVANDGDRIDVDSILRGYTKNNSKAINQQLPHPVNQYQTYMPNDCSNGLETQYSRYTHPAYDIRGLNVSDMRLDYPLHDPQCNIFENFQVNTRLQAKDNHRTTWQIPLNQKDLLPTERLGKVKNCTISVNCNYAPFNS